MRDEQSRSRLVIGLAPVAKSPLDDFASRCFRRLCAVEILRTGSDAVRLDQPDGVARPRVHRPRCRGAFRVHLWICPERSGTPIASLDDPTSFAPQKAIWLEDKLPWVTLDKSLPSFPKSSKTPQAVDW